MKKKAQREAEACYLYSPTKRKFSSFVRINSLVLKAVKIFKLKLSKAKESRGEVIQFKSESTSVSTHEFSLLLEPNGLMCPKQFSKDAHLYEPTQDEINEALVY